MDVRFPGGVAVEAAFGSHVVRTDQPPPLGEGSAASPFDLFLVSLATCAGFYALRFCQERGLSTEGLGVTLTTERDPQKKRLSRVLIELALPAGFPEKYREAVLRAADQCAVKKAVLDPPELEVVTAGSGPEGA
ncbi:osmotically inducible protein OsmC [Acidobacteria bacterium ACD]|nr:MAG: osmotically inducible protein OsmC [Acidobacteriota bacterium]MCE7960378.1 osmotically inducible protein OsmC [Acidobacteria bacterium ACB2]MDL1951928.1 osmotically inducible protein OsmC [Acidobacteria bacterium ACD]